MTEGWSPALRLEEVGGNCRLSLAGLICGHGLTLQEAADDLIARLLWLAAGFRDSGFAFSSECPQPDRASLEFIWEIGERAARGEDIRPRVFGPVDLADEAA